MKLNSNWKMRDFAVGEARALEVASPEYIDYFWTTTKVPGDVHSTLIERKLIEDPFFGHNDQKCRWVEERVWWYRSVFTWTEELQAGERMELTFDGLDTYATVYLNGVELGSTDNMFIGHTFEVTRELRRGFNVLAVRFDPVPLHVKEQVQYYWSGFSKDRIWARKAQSQYGWDWGPRLVCAGIWKDVHLRKRSVAKLESVFARTVSIAESEAIVEIDLELRQYGRANGVALSAEVDLAGANGSVTKRVSLTGRAGKIVLQVEDPQLWWTNDLGEAVLYDLEVRLFADDRLVDRWTQKFGIRTIEVLLTDEQGENCFTFVLNGVKLFAKGANWIPVHSFVASAPDSRYEHLLQLSRDANMNMLRVWGGGIYEKDVFYDECDRLGILVWQDFMFACALYPDYNRNFMENVRREVAETVKRLRSRTCLAIWCGNNENDWLYEALSASGEIPHPFYGEKIYHELMPELLGELDPSRLFWPSSPYGGNDHNARDVGDSHNWQVWHGNLEPRVFGEPLLQNYSVEGVSFKNFKLDRTKFASEFGMHASSNRYTLQSYIPADQFYWGSDEMAYRNKDIHHPKGIMLMEGYTGRPSDIEEYMNFSMLTQAEGLKFGVEHFRRNKPGTSGALFWQLNDCWPGTSWSVIDYFGLPKASYYYARKFFRPVLLTADHVQGDGLDVWVVNDRLVPYEDEVAVRIYDMEGNERASWTLQVSVPANSAAQVGSFRELELLGPLAPEQAVCVIHGSQVSPSEGSFYYFRDHKHMKFPEADLTVEVDPGSREITVSADRFARMVKIEFEADRISMDDNFFDLLPGQSRTIRVYRPGGAAIPWDTLAVSAINVRRK